MMETENGIEWNECEIMNGMKDERNEEKKVLQSVVNEKFECFRHLESERQ